MDTNNAMAFNGDITPARLPVGERDSLGFILNVQWTLIALMCWLQY